MKNLTLLTFIAFAFLVSCKGKYPDFEKAESGLYYRYHVTGKDTAVAKVSDFVLVDMIYKNMNDSIFNQNQPGSPFMVEVKESNFPGDIYEAIRMMHVGDSMTFVLSTDSFFKSSLKTQIPSYLDSNSEFYLTMKLHDIKSKLQMEKEKMEEIARLKEMETKNIEAYIAENKMTATPDSNGIYMVLSKKGSGAKVEVGKIARINYKGSVINGMTFEDTWSEGGQPYNYMVGTSSFGEGFDKALLKMKVGDKAQIIVPSAMAFGERGISGIIPPFSSLIFDIQVEEVMTEEVANKKEKEYAQKMMADEAKSIAKYVADKKITDKPDADGIYITYLKKGTGKKPGPGSLVSVHYTGTLLNGKKFDSSMDRGQPIQFSLGMGEVIPGWDNVVSRMVVGDKVMALIPSAQAYGRSGSGAAIPPFSPLVFEMELISINTTPKK